MKKIKLPISQKKGKILRFPDKEIVFPKDNLFNDKIETDTVEVTFNLREYYKTLSKKRLLQEKEYNYQFILAFALQVIDGSNLITHYAASRVIDEIRLIDEELHNRKNKE